ncbi:PhoD-like phosphatase N-terminal domain-containing protein, partial [Gordonia terrae]
MTTRRDFLRTGAVVTGTALAAPAVVAHAAPRSPESSFARVFAHGIASGDPLPNAVILWTRITPTPAATPGSGIGPESLVRWEVAGDPGFGTVVASGQTRTSADADHTVKVDVTGLAPRTRYHYRFTVVSGPAAGAV